MNEMAPGAGLVTAARTVVLRFDCPENAAAQQKYLRSRLPMRGTGMGALRKAMRSAVADPSLWPDDAAGWRTVLRTLWDEVTYREEWYAALFIAEHRFAAPWRAGEPGANLDLYRHLIMTGAWWDVVDVVATHLVREQLLCHPGQVAATVRSWSTDADLWLRRSAIICQVGAKDRVDLGLLADVIEPNLENTVTADSRGRQDFFIRKAIGWALRDAARTYPQWVLEQVETRRRDLAGLSLREATKHLAP